MNNPVGVATDSSGNIWIADSGNDRVVEYTAGGSWIAYDPGFSGPEGVTVDHNGNVWVADTGNARIVELVASSSYSVYVPSNDNDNGGSDTPLGRPDAIVANLNAGQTDAIWVSDKQNNAIYEFSISGESWTEFTNSTDQLSVPAAIAIDGNSNIWIGDWGNNQIQEYSAGGAWQTPINDGSALVNPSGLAIDASNDIFVTGSNGNVLEYNGSTWASISTGFFTNPKGLVLISNAMYVADDGPGTATNDFYKLCY